MIKMLLRLFGLTLLLTLLAASNVYAAVTYSCRLSVTNTGSALTYADFLATMNNSTLVTNGFILSSGLDVQILDGVTVVPGMLASDRTMFVGSIGTNLYKTFTYTTGNAPAASMPIIIGAGGVITTLDNLNIELGSNFTLTLVGYFLNMATATTNSPVYKQHAIRLYVSAANTLTANILDSNDLPTATASVAAVADGLHTVVISGGGGNFTLQVDAGAPSSVAIGAGVPNTATSYLWNSGNVMPYITSITIVVGGVEKLKYQPTTIVLSAGTTATLPDLDSTQDGTITWGINPTNIVVAVSSMSPITSVVTPTPPVASAPAIISGMTGGPGPTPTPVSSNFPLYGIFEVMANLLNVPTTTMINIGAIFVIVALGAMCLVSRLGPLFTGGIYIILYVMLNFFQIADYWMVFMMVSFIALSWMLPRQTAVL